MSHVVTMNATEACKRVHELLETLPKRDASLEHLPSSGIYFFYEVGEHCPPTGQLRIVRVGTHGAGRTLKRRLRDHYYGNREGSVFRKHLGTALLKRADASDVQIRWWRRKRKGNARWTQFTKVEDEVDDIIRSTFFFRVIPMDRVQERKWFEEKLIATIAACPVCQASSTWLGRFAWSEKVRRSGLWNSQFIDSPARLTANDLLRLKQLAQTNAS